MSNDLPVLYTFIRCPYAMRARLALIHTQHPYEHREVDLKNKPACLLTVSPKGTVPVLVFQDGSVLDESIDIVLYAFGIKLEDLSVSATNLLVYLEEYFRGFVSRYKYPERFALALDDAKEYRDSACTFLENLNEILKSNTFLEGKNLKAIDCLVFPFVRQFAKIDQDFFANLKLKNLHAWIEHIYKSQEYELAMHKFVAYE